MAGHRTSKAGVNAPVPGHFILHMPQAARLLPFALIRDPARRARLFRQSAVLGTDGTKLTQLSFQFELALELLGADHILRAF
jgi:hypothetical protein